MFTFDSLSATGLSAGAVSEGTMRPQDIGRALADMGDSVAVQLHANLMHHYEPGSEAFGVALEWLLRLREHVGAAEGLLAHVEDDAPECEECHALREAVCELHDMLDGAMPMGVRIGWHEGDGACLGVWINVPDPDDCPRGSELPSVGRALMDGMDSFLVVSDHGNATLYHLRNSADRPADFAWREVWSVV